MLRNRIEDEKIYTKPEERANLMRLGALLDHKVSDVLLVVKPSTYRRWLNAKREKRRKPVRIRTENRLPINPPTDHMVYSAPHIYPYRSRHADKK